MRFRWTGAVISAILVGLLIINLQPGNIKAASQPSRFIQGASDAAVEVVEFCDLELPQCQQAQGLLNGLLARSDQKLKISFRHYPITSIHRRSLLAALALEAAGAQGKFWEYQQLLLAQQTSWSAVGNPQELFVTYAKQAEVADLERFRTELAAEKYKPEILADLALGNQLKPKEIPFFLVNGEQTSLTGLKLAVERLLSKP